MIQCPHVHVGVSCDADMYAFLQNINWLYQLESMTTVNKVNEQTDRQQKEHRRFKMSNLTASLRVQGVLSY